MTSGQAWIAYVVPFPFPWGSAGARRVFGVAAALATAGHHVVVLSSEAGPPVATALDGLDVTGSVSRVGLGAAPDPSLGPLRRAARSLAAQRGLLGWLTQQPTAPSHVLLYGGGGHRAGRLRSWCRARGVPLIADVVEWYDPRHLPGGPLGPTHLNNELAMRYQYPRCDGVIAISSYLADYYRRRGTRVLRVPPTLDVVALDVDDRPDDGDPAGLRLVYCGSPGRKDLLGAVIEAVDRVHRAGVAVSLTLCGPSTEQVRRLVGGPVPPSVRCRGSLPQQDVPAIIRRADFSVILRRDARYAHAGFPTKFCESLANGTPVIANLTSDLGRYLHDGREGLVCQDPSVDTLCSVLAAAARLSPARRAAMREAARRQALASFDYRAFARPLADFVDEVRSPAASAGRETAPERVLDRR